VQIVHGLVANAHRHAGETPIDVRATVADGYVVVRVEDRGPGVARGLREQIFDPGFREDQAIEGHGLGLAIGRRLAREQGGDLWFESRPGGGAAFVLSLAACGNAGPGVNAEGRSTGLRLA
jgi:signal transduction histidine kinase